MKSVKLLLCLAILLFLPSQVFAISTSLADLSYATYGAASHYDQYNEWLGVSGALYDALTWSQFTPGAWASISLTAHVGEFWGTGDFEYLSLWVDWDQNRVFDVDEEVLDLDDYWFDYGDNPITHNFVVPTDAVMGTSWMRARLTFDGDLYPTDDLMGGMAYTGEVEDYAMNVVPEPGTLVLLGFGLLSLAGYRKAISGKKRG
jgi:hypothetical protein